MVNFLSISWRAQEWASCDLGIERHFNCCYYYYMIDPHLMVSKAVLYGSPLVMVLCPPVSLLYLAMGASCAEHIIVS